MKITYIYHSCFCIELDEVILLFDYYTGELPQFDEAKPIYAFASHRHHDHFDSSLFQQLAKYREVSYILSDDIRINEKFLMNHGISNKVLNSIYYVSPNRSMQLGDLSMETLKSTDQGVAFSVQYNDVSIYHAGDLNWWHWSGESNSYNQKMEQHFKLYLQKIEGKSYDVAFLPLDSRQEDCFWWGFDYFMKHTNTKLVFPMHFWDDSSVIEKLMQLDASEEYKNRIMDVTKDSFWEV